MSMLFAAHYIPTAIMRTRGQKIGSVEYNKVPHGSKCAADGKYAGKQPLVSEVDVAWPYDGVGPITMGFANPGQT